MEPHIGCSAFHPGQFCDEIDEDTVRICLYLVDFIYSRIPVFKTSKTETNESENQANKAQVGKWLKGILGAVVFHLKVSLFVVLNK